jgi:hypothetical protein
MSWITWRWIDGIEYGIGHPDDERDAIVCACAAKLDAFTTRALITGPIAV